ncbi:hypothetical protein A2V82_01660 [candidate division KSB1 bacterium RBG_16_48_16]|nr:MAG: hypothetical protein A2V82_01660 [candidate division KSB1 bacterium RBG_16_48_16]
MPTRITPLDVKTFAPQEVYRKGEQMFEGQLVKHRFRTNYGLQATVRGTGNFRVEMVVDGDQLFGRCSCHDGGTPCEHMVSVLLSWVNEPNTFTSYQSLRKAIREKDKNTLVDVLINLIEIWPELSQFFISAPGSDELATIREDVADLFDFPLSQKIDPTTIIESCRIQFARAKIYRNEGKWSAARILFFEVLNRTLALVDSQQTQRDFPENFIAELGDDYEEIALGDPEFDQQAAAVAKEVEAILSHESAEIEGVLLDSLKERLNLA